MNEAEWLTCHWPRPMLEFLQDRATDRKERLFAVACCRAIPHLHADAELVRAVEAAESIADEPRLRFNLEPIFECVFKRWMRADEEDQKSTEAYTLSAVFSCQDSRRHGAAIHAPY